MGEKNSIILHRAGAGLLAVLGVLQLEAGIPHIWHVVIVCVSIFLAYMLGQNQPSTPKAEK